MLLFLQPVKRKGIRRMKKTLTVLVTVAALLVAVILADRATRRHAAPRGAAPDSISVGVPAPDFTVKNLQDQNVSLSQYKGKVVLVNFWATLCAPCREEIPLLIALQEKYGPQGFTVLGVAMDDEGKQVVAPYFEKERFPVAGTPRQMNYPILIGTDDVAEKFGGLIGFPTSVLVSRDGVQVKRITGQLNDEDIDQAIKSLL